MNEGTASPGSGLFVSATESASPPRQLHPVDDNWNLGVEIGCLLLGLIGIGIGILTASGVGGLILHLLLPAPGPSSPATSTLALALSILFLTSLSATTVLGALFLNFFARRTFSLR